MAKNKTTDTGESVDEFINAVDNEQKRNDSFELIKLMRKVSKAEPRMWGPSIIGFGNYHYKYESGHEGDAPLLGFSPRKAAISLYVFTGLEEHEYLLAKLGKYKLAKACIYVKTLKDIDLKVLGTLMQETIKYLQKKYGKK